MAWSNKDCIDCDRVNECLELPPIYNTKETCIAVDGITDETFNVYEVFTRDELGNYLGPSHYEWFDHTRVDETQYTITPLGACNCCDAICAKPFVANRRCFLYTQLGSTYTFGAGGFLADPSIFDDPCPPGNPFGPCTGFDHACTNMYPIQVEFEDMALSTDAGATWTHFSPSTITYNSPADVNFRDDGYGLGWSDFADKINPLIRHANVQLRTNSGNGGVWEYANGADETNTIVRVAWRWKITGGFCSGADGLDPYELAWAQEWQKTSTDGQSFLGGDGNNPTSTYDVEDGTHTAPIDSCENI